MAESGFLVTLPSNSNMSTDPDNTPSDFTVKLAEPLNLNGDWEAALVSVQYTPSWITFAEPAVFVVAYDKRDYDTDYRIENKLNNDDRTSWHLILADHRAGFLAKARSSISTALNLTYREVVVYPKYYESPEAYADDICKAINNSIMEQDVGPSLSYVFDNYKKMGRFVMSGGKIDIAVVNNPEAIQILGHETTWLNCRFCKTATQVNTHPSPHYYSFNLTAEQSPKLVKINSLWVYNDITQHQQVGDTKAPLLGIIPTHNVNGQRVHYTVNPVHYLALNHNHIPEIRIKITDDKGKLVPFASGQYADNVVCCLRFRRRKVGLTLPI